MPIEWTERLRVGVEEIDNQHKELFKRINNLLDACTQGKGKDEVLNTLRFLDDYVTVHFTAEERLQQKYNYPDYVSHKAQHAEFIKNISDIKKAVEEEGAGLHLVIRTNRTVVDWLINHIGKMDKKVGALLKEKI